MKQQIILRPHQQKCIDLMRAYPDKYAVAEVAVAGGKSLVLGCLAGFNNTGRTLILAHNKELVHQNADACKSVGIQPGICSASIGKNVFSKVTVGTVQTIVRRTKSFQDVNLILVDEVHRCFHPDHELLTRHGWIAVADVAQGEEIISFDADTGACALEPVTRIVTSIFNGNLIELKNSKFCTLTTPNHEQPFLSTNALRTGDVKPRRAIVEKLPSAINLPVAAMLRGDATLTAWERLLIAFEADGHHLHTTKDSYTHTYRFTFRRKRKIDQLTKLLSELSIPYRALVNARGDTSIIFKHFARMSKNFDWYSPLLSARKNAAFLDELTKWDGHERTDGSGEWEHNDRSRTEFIQTIAHLCGRYCSVFFVRKRHWRASWTRKTQVWYEADSRHMERNTVPYTGLVHCVTVPSGNVLTRYAGKISISGNCPVNKTSSYRKVFEAIPHAKVRGLTGTPFRADGTGSLEKTFGPIIYRYSFLDALRDGYVKPLIPAHSEAAQEINTEGVKTIGEDYDLDELASRAIALSPLHSKAITQTMQRQGRKCVLVFACNCEHADVLEKEINALGVRAASVHSKSPKGKREKMVVAFRARTLSVLISVAMFDTGFNAVDIDLEVFCRATKSPVFFAQALGRGARLTPHAENCAVLDFGGNVGRHGALDQIAASPGVELRCDPCGKEWETWKYGRTCPECGAVHKSATKCKGCAERFDQFYHGATCPHCGLLQSSVKTCNACSNIYAVWLHPICPRCEYDNTSLQQPGKDLTEGGALDELINTTDILKAQPWQHVTRPPFKTSSWQIPTRYMTVKWPFDLLPENIAAVYLTKAGNGHITIKGWYDRNGAVHQV